ncbi:MAG: lysylphosphatidylglycerol synthase transmembrane domain-containing protein [Candidatus Berkelbacteria bacterium]|nr:lysylphosphatidylglycerol synthase transmembrane domain-containing protein [Candidatus Berkelbacteria bacterium]
MKNKNYSFSLGKIMFMVVLGAFAWYAVKHLDQTKQIVTALTKGKIEWVLLAVLVLVFYYYVYTIFFKTCFVYFDLNYSKKRLLMVYLATKFTAIALPLATIGQIALFVGEAKKEGEAVVSATFAAIFAMVTDVIAFWIISLLPLFVLGQSNNISSYYQTVFGIFTLIVAALMAAGYYYFRNKKFSHKIFDWISKSLQKFNIELPEEEYPRHVSGQGRKIISKALAISLSLQILQICILSLMFLAFGQENHLNLVLVSYTVGILFTILSITPQGAGVAEATMVITMVSGGVPLENAVLITVGFRGLIYLVPVLPGFWAFNRLKLLTGDSKK